MNKQSLPRPPSPPPLTQTVAVHFVPRTTGHPMCIDLGSCVPSGWRKEKSREKGLRLGVGWDRQLTARAQVEILVMPVHFVDAGYIRHVALKMTHCHPCHPL